VVKLLLVGLVLEVALLLCLLELLGLLGLEKLQLLLVWLGRGRVVVLRHVGPITL
jgi:hypothetical protein